MARSEPAAKMRQFMNTDDCREQSIGTRRERLGERVLQTKNIPPRHDDILWDLMTTTDKTAQSQMNRNIFPR